ncbi:hypothetical protein HAX54_013742, partial [Datura stramonium]|nr:hypothetical protein [Datura stramonium]
YPLNSHAMTMCRIKPAFVESLDDDVPKDEERRRVDSNIELYDDEANDSDLGEEAFVLDEEIDTVV